VDEFKKLFETDDIPKFIKEYIDEHDDLSANIIIPIRNTNVHSWDPHINNFLYLIKNLNKFHSIKNDGTVSLIGFSSGGTGAIELAAMEPTVFTTIVPLAAGLHNVTDS
jgi:esterase/lipase